MFNFFLIKGLKQINQYQIIKLLGEGSSCKVKLVLNLENNEKFALKCFNKSLLKKRTKLIKTADGSNKKKKFKEKIKIEPSYKTALQDVYREIEIMKKLDNKNIIKLFEIIDQKDGNGLYMG